MFGALSLAAHLRYALIIILVVVIVILLSKWTGSGSGGSCNTSMSQKFGKFARLNQGKDTTSSNNTNAVAQKLMTESREWARETDSPTISPVGQLVNATYALSYAQASQALSSPGGPDKDAEALINDMKAKQSQAVQYLAKTYPAIV